MRLQHNTRKWTASFLIAFFLLSLGNAYSQKIDFFKGRWEKAKKKALKTDRYIFVDAYTDWCGWCKVMDKKTFTDGGVANFINDRFIPLKLDMEEGIGMQLAMKYRVNSFPTFLFFNPQGRLVYKSFGYQEPDQFMESLKEALDPGQHLQMMGVSDQLDLPFPEFYKKAFGKKKQFPDSTTVHRFLDKQEDLFSEVSWSVIHRFPTNKQVNRFLFENIEKYTELYGKQEVERKLSSISNHLFEVAVKNKDRAKLGDAIAIMVRYFPVDPHEMRLRYEVRYYERIGDWSNCVLKMNQLLELKGHEDHGEINSLAWTIYLKAEELEVIQSAISWMKPVVKTHPEYAYLDTFAALLYRNKQYKEAEKYALRAIAAGKEEGERVGETEKLLEKIRKEKP